MESLNKRDYKAKLEEIRDTLRKNFDDWAVIEVESQQIRSLREKITLMSALVKTIIAIELYQLDCEENGGGNDQDI